MHRPHRMAAVALAGALALSGCYGPFTLTRKVYNWNGKVSDNKWVVEAVFLVCAWLPVYGIATAADAIIFNSVEFWTGKSLLDAKASGDVTRRIARKDVETILTRTANNDLVIEQRQAGKPAASLRLRREGEGVVALNADGSVVFRAQTLPDGTVIVADAEGRQVATYSSEQSRQFLASLPQ